MSEHNPLSVHDDALSVELRALAVQVVPDPAFAQALEAKLAQSPLSYSRNATVRFHLREWATVAAAAMFVILIGFTTITPLRAWAQQVIEGFFDQLTVDENQIVYNDVDMNTIPRVTTLEAADALEAEFGFDVLLPTAGLQGAQFENGFYSASPPSAFLSLSFRAPEMLIVIYQLRSHEGENENWTQVGASATILDRMITFGGKDVLAQSVQGAWGWQPPMGAPTLAPGQGLNEVMEWDSTIPMRRLRWQQGEITYEVSASALGASAALPTLEDLIVIAEGLR